MYKHPVKVAIIPVAGRGTRMMPATKAVPKELLPILEKPLLQYAIEEAKAAGIEYFIFVSSKEKPLIEEHLRADPFYTQCLLKRGQDKLAESFADGILAPHEYAILNQDAPRGLGHAVWCAREIIGRQPFAVLSPDDYILGESCMQEMVQSYQNIPGHNVIAVMPVAKQNTKSYGIIQPGEVRGDLISATHVVEKPDPKKAPSNLAIIGRYILQPEVMDILARHEIGVGGEIQLTDAFHPDKVGLQLWGAKFSGQRFDCGSLQGWLAANLATAAQDPFYSQVVGPNPIKPGVGRKKIEM